MEVGYCEWSLNGSWKGRENERWAKDSRDNDAKTTTIHIIILLKRLEWKDQDS